MTRKHSKRGKEGAMTRKYSKRIGGSHKKKKIVKDERREPSKY